MASVKGGPEFRVYMNWKTGYVAELEEYPRSKEQAAEGLEQVFLCWHDGSDSLFIDPAMSTKEPRYGEVEHLDLIDFSRTFEKLTGKAMPLTQHPGRLFGYWEGGNHSAVVNASVAPEECLKTRMLRLDAALLKLTETIDNILYASRSG